MRKPPPEYPLPAIDLPAKLRRRLHPWIAGFIGLTSAQANHRLADRWARLTRPSLRMLAKTLCDFSVIAIADFQEGGTLHLEREGPDGGFEQSWYLPGPLPPEVIEQQLAAHGLEKDAALTEFLRAFAGLAEECGNTAGSFAYGADDRMTFDEPTIGLGEHDIEGFRNWEGSLRLFYASNGCWLLIRPDGKLAWWIMQEQRIALLDPHIDAFAKRFADYQKLNHPFDPYGP